MGGSPAPGGAVVKSLPANAGDTGSSPGLAKIPHAVEQLSPCATTTKPALYSLQATTTEPASHNYWARVPQLLKPVHLEPVLCNKRSYCNEKPEHRNEE